MFSALEELCNIICENLIFSLQPPTPFMTDLHFGGRLYESVRHTGSRTAFGRDLTPKICFLLSTGRGNERNQLFGLVETRDHECFESLAVKHPPLRHGRWMGRGVIRAVEKKISR